MSKIITFTDLRAWQESHVFVVNIYRATKDFPREELFRNQLIIAKDIKYISDSDYNEMDKLADKAQKLLHGLIIKTKSFYEE